MHNFGEILMMTKPLIGVVALMFFVTVLLYTANLKLKNELQVAIIKVEAAETSLRTAQQEAELADKQFMQFTIKMATIEKERNEARIEVDKMRDLFQDHDFAKLITRKPGLIENLMIKKTKEVYDEIEALTAP